MPSATMMASEKAKRRLESKKRKISAFLQVAELNDDDKRQKILNGTEEETNTNVEKKTLKTESPAKEPLLSGTDLDELRHRLRERKKLLKQIPDFSLKSVGHEAEIDMQDSFRTPLFMKDLQQMMLQALLGKSAPIEPLRWCKFTSWSRLTGMLCLIIEGLGVKDFHEHRSDKFSKIAEILKIKMEFLSPASYDSKVAEDFSLIAVSQRQRDLLKKQFGDIAKAVEQGSAYRLLRSVFPTVKLIKHEEMTKSLKDEAELNSNLKINLLLSLSQMIEEGYPVPIEGPMREKYKHFKMTKPEYDEVTPDSPLFSIDCEMCLTTSGASELTKICVINSDMEVVYSSFVKPFNTITNYLTRFSGITKEMLQDVTTRLEDVQNAISELLPSDAILVGHSLNSDLCAMQMMHPYVIDTSVIYCVSGIYRKKEKLAYLSQMFLGQKIQQDKKGPTIGHDPKEDAEAAMKLVLLKLEKGYAFGDNLIAGNQSGPTPQNPKAQVLAKSIFTQAKENNKSVCVIGEKRLIKQYKKYSRGALASTTADMHDNPDDEDASGGGVVYAKTSSAKESIAKACEMTFQHHLTICHVDLSKIDHDEDEAAAEDEAEALRRNRQLKYAKKWTKKLWSHTSKNGLFVTVWPGDKDQNAFVGIRCNKAEVPELLSSTKSS